MQRKLVRPLLGIGLTLTLAFGTAGAVTLATPTSAQAYWTSSNWYSKSWFLNRSETYSVAKTPPAAAFSAGWGVALPWQAKLAIRAYWGAFSGLANYAYNRGRCLRITWIYVNLPYPDQWWGRGC